jgi:hypothetical protein
MKMRSAVVAALFGPLLALSVARADYGPPTAIRAARAAELHRWHIQCPPSRCADPVLDIIVVDRYALIDWTTERSGGQSLLEFAPSKGWYRLAHGRGEMGEGILAALTGDAAAHRLMAQYEAYVRRR